jgi:hypothetical protein
VLLVGPAIAAADFDPYSPSNPDYPQKVDWVTSCRVTKTADDDPIIFPGQPGRSHNHTFSGSLEVDASSVPEQLIRAGTNCEMSRDHAAYWMPTLRNDGQPVMPYEVRAYYRAGTTRGADVKPMPFGLRMIAGNAMATSPQDPRVAGFHCRRDGAGAITDKTALPPRCPSGSFLEASVVFPNCWDGRNLDAPDHRSHMAYAVDGTCDRAHPVLLPQLTVAERFPVGSLTGTVTTAAMNSPMTLHADFMNAWDPAAMRYFVQQCINASIGCEDVSDRRLPPGAPLPPPDPLPPIPVASSPVPGPGSAPAPAPAGGSGGGGAPMASGAPVVRKALTFLLGRRTLRGSLARMPRLARLARRYGHATNYVAPARSALPNVMAMLGGTRRATGSTVFGQAVANGRSARVYVEDLPGACARGSGRSWPYVAAERGLCRGSARPFGRLARAIRTGTIPNVTVAVPDRCHAGACGAGRADRWLSRWLSRVFAGPDWRTGRLAVVVTFATSGRAGGKVLTVVAHPSVKGRVRGRLGPYSWSRSMSQLSGASPLRRAGRARSLLGAFGCTLPS